MSTSDGKQQQHVDTHVPAPSKVPQWLQVIPMPRAHWTPRYLWSRLKLANFQRKHPEAPWITQQMVAFLDEYLRPSDMFVEFGSGRSTMWYAKRVGRVISVEHHKQWHAKITQTLAERNIRNVDYLNPEESSEDYLGVAQRALNGAKADAILIDGIFRDHCATWALNHVKPGGMIIIDNVNWFIPHQTKAPPKFGTHPLAGSPRWKEFIERTKSWRLYWSTNNISDTAAYFAPGV